jgi:ketosteroid isomerase-like protein
MSWDNVEVLRAAFAAFNDRGIESAIDSFEHLLSDDFELEEATEVPDRERHGGRSGFLANLRKFEEEFEDLRVEPVSVVDLGDRLIVDVAISGRGRVSGAPIDARFAQLWSMRDGKAVSLRDYATKSEALGAARLSE